MELVSTKRLVEKITATIDDENVKILAVILKRNTPSDELSYLKSIAKNAEFYNFRIFKLYADTLEEMIRSVNIVVTNHSQFSGVIILSHYSDYQLFYLNDLDNFDIDTDCQSQQGLSHLFFDKECYHAPCTANAIYQIVIDNFGFDLSGKNIAIINRSLTVGRPAATLLMKNNATVTVFHSKSKIESLDNYDIIITATGKINTINRELFSADDSKEHFIIDVGIIYDEENKKLCGDVNLESFENSSNFKIVASPGGVGPLSTAILLSRCS